MCAAFAPVFSAPLPAARFAHSRPATRQRLWQTLLFLGAAGLRRPWDLRGYTGSVFDAVVGRTARYTHVERFLAAVATTPIADQMTDCLARWTTALWAHTAAPPLVYIDGHHKPIYSKTLLPRGLVGRLSKILSCRGLVLLHDAQGHPLMVTTGRGDEHLTAGMPTILQRYTTATDTPAVPRIVVDREGMAAEMLHTLAVQGQSVVTILRTNQYTGLDSFSAVGPFSPLAHGKDGRVLREVASAQFALKCATTPDQRLPLQVALIRDWRKADAVGGGTAEAATAKLIPIVTTAATADAVELVATYTRRWPCQENVIKDWLLPVGLDTNHGFAKTGVTNSETQRRQTALTQQIANCTRWADAARQTSRTATLRYRRQWTKIRDQIRARDRAVVLRERELAAAGTAGPAIPALLTTYAAPWNATIAALEEKQWQAYRQSNAAHQKAENYRQKQTRLHAAVAALAARERPMAEVDNAKDQVMTVLKVTLANLGMWLRDHYFPPDYAQATWHRLVPFFRLGGWVQATATQVTVSFRPFADRQRTRDLATLCVRVNATHPTLPDGRHITLAIAPVPTSRPILLLSP